MTLSQSNFNLRSPDSDSVRSYLIATVYVWKKSYKKLLAQGLCKDTKIHWQSSTK